MSFTPRLCLMLEATLKYGLCVNTKVLTIVLQGLETAALYVKYYSVRKEPASGNTLIKYREYSIKYIYYSGDIKL